MKKNRNEKQPAFIMNSKNKIEVFPDYFVAKIVKRYGLIHFSRDGWYEWSRKGWKPARKCIIQARIRDLLKETISDFCGGTTPVCNVVNTANINEILRMLNLECD